MGCTASGKTEVAIELARRLGDAEVLVADSMQVYRGMDIGTAKPDSSQRGEMPHHLLDLADPAEEWSVERWRDAAATAIAGIEARGHRALLVAGTGLYFQALVDGLRPPTRYPDVRRDLECQPDTARLHRRLEAVDPVAAGRMHPSNRRRVIRALEVSVGSGRPFSSFGAGISSYPPTPWRIAGVWLPRSVVAARISARLDGMVASGLVEEVRGLASRPGGWSHTARQALGYKELLRFLTGAVGLEDALNEAVRRTREFSRRQRVWWRRDPRIAWYGAAENPFAVMDSVLGNWMAP